MQEIFAVFGIDWKLLLVNIFNFVVLLLALTYLLYKPVIKLTDLRRKKAEKILRQEEEINKKMQELAETEKKTILQAKQKAQEIVESAQKEAQKNKDEILQEAQAKALTILANAKKQAEEEKRAVMQEAKEELAKEATLVAKKILANT